MIKIQARNEGIQVFLEINPINFNRILPDYSDERKGFFMERCIGEMACLERNLMVLEPIIDYIAINYCLLLNVLFLNQTQKSPQNQMI